MIKLDKQVTIFKPKKYTSGKGVDFWKFSIGDSDFDKETKAFKNNGFINVTVFNNNIELNDKQKIKIKSITGVGINDYNGNKSFSIIAELDIEEEVVSDFELGDSSDLPF